MNRHLILAASIVGSLILVPLSASAKGKGKGKGNGKGKPAAADHGKPSHGNKADRKPGKDAGPAAASKEAKEWRKAAKFADRERNELLTFWGQYHGNERGLPPGLAKNLRRGKPLPPGWQKKIHSGWIVDDDWWGMFHPVPPAYLPRGFPLPPGTGMFLFGDRLVRVHEPTREVIDFLVVPGIIP